MAHTEPAGPEPEAAGSDVPRLVVSWLIVGVPLVYGVVETIRAILPLFGG
ncbi:MFS transporter small subunit [Actinomadura fibrosa]|uniref:Uncharacterized protein n=1 Tax=Actinomadura fibrosa TaxID=111802 RepID=A0ABW2Y323_9ACTN|nr:hypothetical protein [Actinomadura fibrosa]